jgi:hypothetical protein
MQIKGFLASQAIRFFAQAPEPVADRRSPIPMIRGLQDLYGFVQVPTTIADMDFTKGVSFYQGYFKGAVIDKFQIYENGVLCEARANNHICDEFISEVIEWATSEHDIPVRQSGAKAFVSQLEVVSPIDLDKHLSMISSIGALIFEAVKSYGQAVAQYHMSGIKLHYDTMSTPIPRPPEFTFERRAGQAYSTSEFFTSAPLQTADHMRVLDHLERIFDG